MSLDFSGWQDLAKNLKIETRAFINGQYTEAQTKAVFPCINPSNEEVIAQITLCDEAEVDAAVKAARAAFDSGVWSDLAPRKRAEILKNFASLIRAHAEELTILETLDVGKPVSDCLPVDIMGSAYCVEWFAEAIDKIGGEVAPLDPKLFGTVTREAIGVVAAVVPWNFPMLMSSWKYAPALAAGNAVILKPSEKSPLSAIRLAAIAKEAGIPDGIFQVLPGAGQVGKLLASHHDIDCVAFTGSTAVGKLIAEYAAKSNLKRVWLELGGKSPHIIFADCPDIVQAAKTAAAAIFYNMGEMCSAGSRVLVQKDIKDVFLAEFKKQAAVYIPSNPIDPNSNMGPIVDHVQYEKILGYIEKGKAEGATLICGGHSKKVDGKGYFIEPTAFSDVNQNHTIAQEEIFGPVLSIIEFDTEDEAIAIANNSEYGLAAGLWTSNLSTAHKVSRKLRAGTVWVNCYDEGGDMNLPFGGFKQSGNGRDKSLHALEKYTELKATLIKL